VEISPRAGEAIVSNPEAAPAAVSMSKVALISTTAGNQKLFLAEPSLACMPSGLIVSDRDSTPSHFKAEARS